MSPLLAFASLGGMHGAPAGGARLRAFTRSSDGALVVGTRIAPATEPLAGSFGRPMAIAQIVQRAALHDLTPADGNPWSADGAITAMVDCTLGVPPKYY